MFIVYTADKESWKYNINIGYEYVRHRRTQIDWM